MLTDLRVEVLYDVVCELVRQLRLSHTGSSMTSGGVHSLEDLKGPKPDGQTHNHNPGVCTKLKTKR